MGTEAEIYYESVPTEREKMKGKIGIDQLY